MRTDPEPTDLTYSRVLLVRQQPQPAGDDELLTLARDRAPDPSSLDDLAPYFFGGEMSSSRWDAYDTAMQPSTLRNFAGEAAQGVAFLRGHDTRRDPIGQTLTGRFVSASGNGVARAETQFYTVTDPDSATFVNRMRAGAIRDLSVGFYGGRWMCTICQRDMQQWMTRDGCPHLLGMMYTPRDEAGQPAGEPQKARAQIEDAHLAELSGVYDGATPGAMVQKARGMAAEGRLDPRQRELVEVRYRLHLPEPERQFPGGGPGKPVEQRPDGREERMSRLVGTIEADSIRLSDGRQVSIEELVTLTITEGMRAAVVELRLAPDGDDPAAVVRAAGVETSRLRLLAAPLLALTPPAGEADPDGWRVRECERRSRLAGDGERYRRDLIAEALTEGVRAYGETFPRAAEQVDLEAAGLDTIKRRLEQWRLVAEKTFPGGRLTTDAGAAEQPAAKPRTAALPAGAFG